jgi:hypothetical protein
MSEGIGPTSSFSSYEGNLSLPDNVKKDLQTLKDLLKQLQTSQDDTDSDQIKGDLKKALQKLKQDLQGLMHQGHPASTQLQSLLMTPMNSDSDSTSLISSNGQVANSNSLDDIKDFLNSDDGKDKLHEVQSKIKNLMNQH